MVSTSTRHRRPCDGAASLHFAGDMRAPEFVQVRSIPNGEWRFGASVTAFVGDTPYALTARTVHWSSPDSNQRYAFPTGFADLFLISAALEDPRERSGGSSARRVIETRAPVGGDAFIDFGAALPLIESLEMTQSGTGQASVRWRTDGDVRGADYGLIVLRWPGASAAASELRWVFVVPASAERLDVPELPEHLRAALGGQVQASFLSFTDDERISSYRELKSRRQLAWPLSYQTQEDGTWILPSPVVQPELGGPHGAKETFWSSSAP